MFSLAQTASPLEREPPAPRSLLTWCRRCSQTSILLRTRRAYPYTRVAPCAQSFKRSASGALCQTELVACGSMSACKRGADRGDIGSIRCARRLRCPIAASTRNATFYALSFEIARCLRELRPVNVVEGIDVHDRISNALDHARHDRNNSTGLTDVEIGRHCSESVLARLGRIGNPHTKPPIGMRRPNTPVFPTVSTATCPDRDCVSRTWPIHRKPNVAAVTASVDLSERGLVRHRKCP